VLQGKIDRFPVVLEINGSDDSTASALYYYKSTGKNIELDGLHLGNTYFLHATSSNRSDNEDTLEQLTLTPGANGKYTGTWKNNKGKHYDVLLEPMDVAALKSPYIHLPAVQKMYKSDPLTYVRALQTDIIKDSVVTEGKYKIQYVHAGKTGIYMIQIIAGLSPKLMKDVNDILMDGLLEEADEFYSCSSPNDNESYGCDISSLYISDHILSLNLNVQYYCGGAHPDGGDSPINISL